LILGLFAGSGDTSVVPSLLAVLTLVVSHIVLYLLEVDASIAAQ